MASRSPFFPEALQRYVIDHSVREHPVLAQLRAETAELTTEAMFVFIRPLTIANSAATTLWKFRGDLPDQSFVAALFAMLAESIPTLSISTARLGCWCRTVWFTMSRIKGYRWGPRALAGCRDSL